MVWFKKLIENLPDKPARNPPASRVGTEWYYLELQGMFHQQQHLVLGKSHCRTTAQHMKVEGHLGSLREGKLRLRH